MVHLLRGPSAGMQALLGRILTMPVPVPTSHTSTPSSKSASSRLAFHSASPAAAAEAAHCRSTADCSQHLHGVSAQPSTPEAPPQETRQSPSGIASAASPRSKPSSHQPISSSQQQQQQQQQQQEGSAAIATDEDELSEALAYIQQHRGSSTEPAAASLSAQQPPSASGSATSTAQDLSQGHQIPSAGGHDSTDGSRTPAADDPSVQQQPPSNAEQQQQQQRLGFEPQQPALPDQALPDDHNPSRQGSSHDQQDDGPSASYASSAAHEGPSPETGSNHRAVYASSAEARLSGDDTQAGARIQAAADLQGASPRHRLGQPALPVGAADGAVKGLMLMHGRCGCNHTLCTLYGQKPTFTFLEACYGF